MVQNNFQPNLQQMLQKSLQECKHNKEGQLFYRRKPPLMALILIPFILLSGVFLVINIVQTGEFTLFNAFFILMHVVLLALAILSYFRAFMTITLTDTGIEIAGGFKAKRVYSWQEIVQVSAFMPVGMRFNMSQPMTDPFNPTAASQPPVQPVAMMSMLIYFKDSQNREFAIPAVMSGFSDFFKFLTTKLEGKGFDLEFAKIVLLYRQHHIDVLTKQPYDPDPFKSDDSPFGSM